MAAPAEDPAEAAADRSEVPDSLGGRQSFAPARPGVNVARGEDALRAYLAWDGHARAAHMDPDAFARWLEREVLQYLTANRASLLRARADGVRRLHAPTLDPLAHALERAEAEYRGSAEGARIERATHAVAQRRAAVAGIRSFLESTPATPELAAKQAAASDKLEHALASLPAAELELKDAVASSPLWRDVEHKRDALRAERERTGLASADDDARRASNLNGNSLVTKGDDYEKTCADVVADAFLASGGLIGGADGVPTDGVPTEGDGVLLLRNVTLGLHSGELDCVLVRVNRGVDHSGESAFADAIPQDGDGTTGRRTLARRGRTAATQPADDELKETRENSNSPPAPRPAVEVLAVFEFKRNPDDVARGFHSRQTTLAWLAGDEARYDPREWANRRHPSGHFRRGYHPMRLARWVKPPHETRGSVEADAKGGKVGKVLVLTRDSFRGFRRTHRDAQGRGGFYLDGVWLVTRPRTMCGLDAKVRGFSRRFFGSPRRLSFGFSFRLVPTGGDSFAFGQRIWDAIALGPRGSSAVSASFIA